MRVSVVIPAYNRRTYIARAIESVLAQSRAVDEIIVVDDGSTDGTSEVVQDRYGSLVKVLRQENKGAAAARNHGIAEARGEWIALLDSDDVWLLTKIERQLEAVAVFGDEFGACFTDNVFEGDPGLKLSMFQGAGFEPSGKFGALDDPAWHIVHGGEPFITSSLLIRRPLLRQIGGFDESLALGDDTDLFFRLSFRTRFCYVAEPLVRIDRAPDRPFTVCGLCSTRSDRKYDSLERWHAKWLAMPEIAGTSYERPVREKLRRIHYSSLEAKLHDLRFKPALGTARRLNALGDSYPWVALNLIARKVRKLGLGARRSSVGWNF